MTSDGVTRLHDPTTWRNVCLTLVYPEGVSRAHNGRIVDVCVVSSYVKCVSNVCSIYVHTCGVRIWCVSGVCVSLRVVSKINRYDYTSSILYLRIDL